MVGTDITLEKIRAFILSQDIGIMHPQVTDGTGQTVARTCVCDFTKKGVDRFSENLAVNGWSLTGSIECAALFSSIIPELVLPLIIIFISLIAFAILEILFLRQFVYPSIIEQGLEKKIDNLQHSDLFSGHRLPTS